MQLLDAERKGRLVGHKLWMTEAARSISKDMLTAYGLPPRPNDVLKLREFELLPTCWVYINSGVQNGRRREQIENVATLLDTDIDGPSEDRI